MKTNPKVPKTKLKSMKEIQKRVIALLAQKYTSESERYDITIINNIIYNEKAHIVAQFKDFLILDDRSDFLKRYYDITECDERLPKFYEYYETYSKIFPNYTSLLEGKFIYYNIQRKQKMINLQEEMEIDAKLKKKKNKSHEEVFSTEVYDSIIRDNNNEDLEDLLNLKDVSIDMIDKMSELINEIEKNESSTTNVNGNMNNSGNNNNNGTSHYPYPHMNIIMNKKKFMISSLLGRNNSSRKAFGSMHDSDVQKCYYNNMSNMSNNQIPLTDRPVSNNKSCNNIGKQSQSRQFCKTKMISDYSNTVFINNNNFNNQSLIKNAQGLLKSDLNNTNSIPLTHRQQHPNSDFPLTNERERDKSEQSNIKTPPKYTNNFIYIINQNPKFTTNVTMYHNNNNNSNTSLKSIGRNTSRGKHSQHSKAMSNNIQSQLEFNDHKPSIKDRLHNPSYYLEHQASKTRNHLNNHFTLKTSREVGNNLLRTTSHVVIPYKGKDNNFYCSKYQFRKTTPMRQSSKSKANDSKIQQSSKGDLSSMRNESLTKKITMSTNNHTKSFIPKQQMKRFQIKNFGQVFGLNFSNAHSDRNEGKGNQRE